GGGGAGPTGPSALVTVHEAVSDIYGYLTFADVPGGAVVIRCVDADTRMPDSDRYAKLSTDGTRRLLLDPAQDSSLPSALTMIDDVRAPVEFPIPPESVGAASIRAASTFDTAVEIAQDLFNGLHLTKTTITAQNVLRDDVPLELHGR